MNDPFITTGWEQLTMYTIMFFGGMAVGMFIFQAPYKKK